jgi:hypothetical protein
VIYDEKIAPICAMILVAGLRTEIMAWLDEGEYGMAKKGIDQIVELTEKSKPE